MHAAALMSHPAITIPPSHTAAEARRVLEIHRFRHLPVVDPAGSVLGMLSDRQLARVSSPDAAVVRLLARETCLAHPGISLARVLDAMIDTGSGAALVVEPASARVLGVLSYLDVLRESPELSLDPERRVLVPLDMRPASRRALQYALALQGPAAVYAIHVIPEGEATGLNTPSSARSLLRQTLAQRRLTVTHVEVRSGRPATEILAFAGEIEAALLVVPVSNNGDAADATLGSVTGELIRRAHLPVLMLRESSRGV